MRWPLTFYTDRFLPDWSGGRAIGPIIILRPKYKGRDPGIHAHELAHVGQWALTTAAAFAILLPFALHEPALRTLLPASLGAFGLLYLASPVFRLHCEVQAYKVQARHYPDHRIPRFARAIATKYNLQITPEATEKLLREP